MAKTFGKTICLCALQLFVLCGLAHAEPCETAQRREIGIMAFVPASRGYSLAPGEYLNNLQNLKYEDIKWVKNGEEMGQAEAAIALIEFLNECLKEQKTGGPAIPSGAHWPVEEVTGKDAQGHDVYGVMSQEVVLKLIDELKQGHYTVQFRGFSSSGGDISAVLRKKSPNEDPSKCISEIAPDSIPSQPKHFANLNLKPTEAWLQSAAEICQKSCF